MIIHGYYPLPCLIPRDPQIVSKVLVGNLKFEPSKTGISWARNGHTTNDGLVGDARAYLGD